MSKSKIKAGGSEFVHTEPQPQSICLLPRNSSGYSSDLSLTVMFVKLVCVFCLLGELSFLLGGLILHLNYLIASCPANYDWPFGTLPFGLFGSNLDTRDLETYPRTYSGHF